MRRCARCRKPLPKGRRKYCCNVCLHIAHNKKLKEQDWWPLQTKRVANLDPWESLEFTPDTPAPNSVMFNPLG